MPIYEYKCDACKKVDEVLLRFSDPAPTECSFCGKGPLTKLISQTSFALKGSGWYVTDYKGGGSASKGGDTEPAAASGEKAADAPAGEVPAKAADAGTEKPASSPKTESAPSTPAASSSGAATGTSGK
jgi:putative FmdB family regulatory protein